MTDSSKTENSDSTKTRRAPYTAPRLQTFGTFAALTRNVGMMGLLNDGSMTSTNKTM